MTSIKYYKLKMVVWGLVLWSDVNMGFMIRLVSEGIFCTVNHKPHIHITPQNQTPDNHF